MGREEGGKIGSEEGVFEGESRAADAMASPRVAVPIPPSSDKFEEFALLPGGRTGALGEPETRAGVGAGAETGLGVVLPLLATADCKFAILSLRVKGAVIASFLSSIVCRAGTTLGLWVASLADGTFGSSTRPLLDSLPTTPSRAHTLK